MVRPPGIGPGALAWEANMLPLHYRRREEMECSDMRIKTPINLYKSLSFDEY